jgi:hypothetical protein
MLQMLASSTPAAAGVTGVRRRISGTNVVVGSANGIEHLPSSAHMIESAKIGFAHSRSRITAWLIRGDMF